MLTFLPGAEASFPGGVRASWRHRPGCLTRLRKPRRASLHVWFVPERSATIPILTGDSPYSLGLSLHLKNSGGRGVSRNAHGAPLTGHVLSQAPGSSCLEEHPAQWSGRFAKTGLSVYTTYLTGVLRMPRENKGQCRLCFGLLENIFPKQWTFQLGHKNGHAGCAGVMSISLTPPCASADDRRDTGAAASGPWVPA